MENKIHLVQFVHMQTQLHKAVAPALKEWDEKVKKMHLPTLSAKTVRVIKEASDQEILQLAGELETYREVLLASEGRETVEALDKLVKEIRTKRGI